MRKFIVALCMAAMASTGAAFVAAPAGAGAPASNGKVCKLLTGITITPSADPTAAGGRANAKKYSKALSKAAKSSKGDIKKTLNQLSTYFKHIADNNITAVQNEAQDFANAATKYATYIASNCIPGSVGGVSIPKVTIPGQ